MGLRRSFEGSQNPGLLSQNNSQKSKRRSAPHPFFWCNRVGYEISSGKQRQPILNPLPWSGGLGAGGSWSGLPRITGPATKSYAQSPSGPRSDSMRDVRSAVHLPESHAHACHSARRVCCPSPAGTGIPRTPMPGIHSSFILRCLYHTFGTSQLLLSWIHTGDRGHSASLDSLKFGTVRLIASSSDD